MKLECNKCGNIEPCLWVYPGSAVYHDDLACPLDGEDDAVWVQLDKEPEFVPKRYLALKSVSEMIVEGDEYFEIRSGVLRNVLYPIGDAGIDLGFIASIGFDIDEYFKEITDDKS